jgi:hypothetical protein
MQNDAFISGFLEMDEDEGGACSSRHKRCGQRFIPSLQAANLSREQHGTHRQM